MEIQLALKKYYRVPCLLAILTVALFGFSQPAEASALRKAPNNLGLVGYWSFEDGNLSTATDFSGKGNTGTLTNMSATTDWVTGKVGRALDFDGTDDYVAVSTMPALDGTGIVSFSAWVKPASVGNGRTLVSTTSGGAIGVLWRLESNFMYFWPNTSVDPAQSATFTYVADEWTHLMVMHNETTNTTTFWRNGAVITTSSAAAFGGTLQNTTGLAIGSYNSSNYFAGVIDEFRIYNRFLSSAEVTNLYANTGISSAVQANQVRLVSSGLGAFWPFNVADVSGTTAYDRAGSANGTLTNGPTVTTGKVGQALNFDGSDDYVTATNNVTTSGASRTVTAWIYPNSVANSEFLAVESSLRSGSPGFLFGFQGAKLSVYHGGDYRNGPTTLTAKRWYHVVYSFDSSGTAVKTYVNGNLEYTGSHNDGGGGTEVHIGTGYNGYFNGKIDEVRIYNRVLSEAEINDLYHGGRGALSSSLGLVAVNNLVLWHTFDGPYLTKTTATDKSGQGNSGTLAGPAGGQAKPQPKLGKIGQALQFDGTDDYVVTSYQPDLTKPLTVSFWAYYTTDTEGAYFSTALGSTGADGDLIRSKATGDIRIFSGGSFADFTAGRTSGVWSHIVYTNTAVSGGGAGVQTVYVNGASVGTAALSRSTDTAHSIEIGTAQNGSGSAFWNGIMDDLRVYNKALSADEILLLYNLTK